MMKNVSLGLIGLSVLAFLLAVVVALFDPALMSFANAEGLSRACSNLALIAIALRVSI